MGDPGTMPILLNAQSLTGAGIAGDTVWELLWTWGAGFAGSFFCFGIFFWVFFWGTVDFTYLGGAACGWTCFLREEV